MKRVLTGALLLVAFAAAQSGSPASTPEPAKPESVKEGQLRRGQLTYVWSCAMCHGDRAEGSPKAPALSGPDFVTYYGKTPLSLHHYIRDAMPENQPGVLDEQEVMDVTAYLLDFSGLDFPESGLTLDGLEKPLPVKAKP